MSTPGGNETPKADDLSRPQSTLPEQRDGETPVAEPNTEAQDREAGEVRTLAQAWNHLDLEQLAPIAKAEEGGTSADKFRIMFGYQWLSKACG